ncbi:MAG: FkbM family methyltransferase [Lachnospiraceae bacterium]|jgi:hypothetical protein|nr:FkbM family methyltransferase [Lachnospiraceae bacterium]
MKNVIVFGLGEMGKKLIDECLKFDADVIITAILDNNAAENNYKNIPVIKPKDLSKYAYDDIWISTVYYQEIMKQLFSEYGVEKGKMHFVEPVVPVLENRLRRKYKEQINHIDSASDGSFLSDEMKEVLYYLKYHPLRMYCYPFYDEYLNKQSQIQYDDKNGLYYGMYDGKRMYLSRKFNTYEKANAYFNAVTMEQDTRSPHCYWNAKNQYNASGIGVDLGAAEGIFALKVIDQAEHIYLIEGDDGWVEALQYTFEPFQDKVTIFTKYVGKEDRDNYAKLDTLLFSEKIDFIKMDIEGMELEALEGAEKILLNNKMQLAICVYHHREDNEVIGQWLHKRGYQFQNSKGFVVCQGDWELEKDETDFRRALLFANNA